MFVTPKSTSFTTFLISIFKILIKNVVNDVEISVLNKTYSSNRTFVFFDFCSF